jgi:hypothetical protein
MKYLLVLCSLLIFGFAAPILSAQHVFAADDPLKTICDEAIKDNPTDIPATCNANTTDPVAGKDGIILRVARIISAVAGVAAVVMVIYSGAQLIMSGGDSQKVATARKTLIYALVGSVLLIFAQPIITFILNRI